MQEEGDGLSLTMLPAILVGHLCHRPSCASTIAPGLHPWFIQRRCAIGFCFLPIWNFQSSGKAALTVLTVGQEFDVLTVLRTTYLQLWGGILDARCRLSASPVEISQDHFTEQQQWGPSPYPSLRPPDLCETYVLEDGLSPFQSLYFHMAATYFASPISLKDNGTEALDALVAFFSAPPEPWASLVGDGWTPPTSLSDARGANAFLGIPLCMMQQVHAAAYFTHLLYNTAVHPACGSFEPAGPLPLNNIQWSQDTSPWAVPRSCVWPIDDDDTRICTTGAGDHTCGPSDFIEAR